MAKFQLVTHEELTKVLRAVQDYGPPDRRPMWTALFCLLANLGLRISEALNLEWRHIDFEKAQVVVRTLKRKKPTYDVLPMNPRVSEAVKALYTGQLGSERPFPVSRRIAYNVFNACLHRAGIPPRRLHALRHTCATWLLQATGDLALVRDLMRHQNIATTHIYIHATNLREKYLAVPPII